MEAGRVTGHAHELHEISENIVPDAALQARIDAALEPFAGLQEVVGATATGLHRGTSVECPADDFLLTSLQALVPADLYFSQRLALRRTHCPRPGAAQRPLRPGAHGPRN